MLPYNYVVVYINTVSRVGSQQATMPLGIGAMKVRVANCMPCNILLAINIDIIQVVLIVAGITMPFTEGKDDYIRSLISSVMPIYKILTPHSYN